MPTAAIAPLTNAAPTSDALAAVTEHIAIIKQNYRASDWQRVERYLQADPPSMELLLEAKRHIKGVFGGAVEVFLDVTPDPSGADHPFLYARILTTETRREASRKLRLLCRFLQRTDQSNAARPGLDQGRGARLA